MGGWNEWVVVGALVVPEPVHSSPDQVVYFRGLQALTEQLEGDQQATWLVAFYAAWSPACVNFAPVFAKLSNDFGESVRQCEPIWG